MSIKNFIPIEVFQNNINSKWYLDISKLSLSELILLRKELIGIKDDDSITIIDNIISTYYEMNNDNKEHKRKSKMTYYIKKTKKRSHRRYKEY